VPSCYKSLLVTAQLVLQVVWNVYACIIQAHETTFEKPVHLPAYILQLL